MEISDTRYVPISVVSVFAGAGCLFLTVAIAASNMILPNGELSATHNYAAFSPIDDVEGTPKAPVMVEVQPEPVVPEKPVEIEVAYVNLIEPERLVDVSNGLSAPVISTTAPNLKSDFNPIVRSTGWESTHPTGAPEIFASLGSLQVAPPVVREVAPQLSDTRSAAVEAVLPELLFADSADRTDLLGLLGSKEPVIEYPLAGPKLASLGPSRSDTLFPSVLTDPLPAQKEPALAVPETVITEEVVTAEPTEIAIQPEPEPAQVATYTLRPQPRPARPVVIEKPVVAEKPETPKPEVVTPKPPKISNVSVAGSKRVSIVGVFQTRTAVWALLALENGQIVKVTKGTQLSGLRVSRIRGDKIWIRTGNSEKSMRAGDVIMVN